jgi:ferritin-like metal-binding protein YciE
MNLADLFQMRASELLFMVRDFWQMHNLMAHECRQAQMTQLLQGQNEAMRQRISHLEQTVDQFGGVVGPEDSSISQAMLRAHRLFLETNPPPALLDLHNAFTVETMAHLEMAGYQVLVEMAQRLEVMDLAAMLQQDLQRVERTLAQVRDLHPALFGEVGGGGMRKAA